MQPSSLSPWCLGKLFRSYERSSYRVEASLRSMLYPPFRNRSLHRNAKSIEREEAEKKSRPPVLRREDAGEPYGNFIEGSKEGATEARE